MNALPYAPAAPDSPEAQLATALLPMINGAGQPAHVVLNVLFSFYMQIVQAMPDQHAAAREALLLGLQALEKRQPKAGTVPAEQAPQAQRDLAQALVKWLVQREAPHAEALGALLSVFRHLALNHRCCLATAAMNCGQLAGELLTAMSNEHPSHVH